MGLRVLKNCVVILDKASAHKSHVVQKYLQDNQIACMLLPTGSSSLNNIERCWALMKTKFEGHLLQAGGYMPLERMRTTITEVIKEHLDGHSHNFAEGNKQVWVDVLGGKRC